MTVSMDVVLVVFYLLLAVKWNFVRRPKWFFRGLVALIVLMLVGPLAVENWFIAREHIGYSNFWTVVYTISALASFICAVAACCGPWQVDAGRQYRAETELKDAMKDMGVLPGNEPKKE